MAEAQGFEPWGPFGPLVFKTSALNRTRPHFLVSSGAGNRVRTDDIQIGNLTLYQLSYTRIYFGANQGIEPHHS